MNKVIILIIIIFIILLLCLLCFKDSFSNFNYDENKEVYRLGDILTHQAICKGLNCKPEEISLEKIVNDYPDSLGADYIKQSTKRYDIDLLLNIIKNKNLFNPNQEYVAIHIRLGDVLCVNRKDKWMSKRGILDYKIMYQKIINYIKSNNISNNYPIKIYTFFHKDHYTKQYDLNNCIQKKSSEYLNKIHNLLNQDGFNNIQIYTNRFPDLDVVDCINAKHFIESAGNFSYIILNLRNKILNSTNKNFVKNEDSYQ